MAKTDNTQIYTDEKISVCDIMKNNTSRIIKKLESQIPSGFQQYSDLYTEYLHTMDHLYGICYLSEKEFFDKLDIDQGILKEAQSYLKNITTVYLDQVDLFAKYREEFIQIQKSYLRVYDKSMQSVIDTYEKMFSHFNRITNRSN